MEARFIILFIFLLLVVFISAALLFTSAPIALGIAIALTASILVFFKPFYGLLLYLVLLYVRPQDFIPALERLRIMLALAILILSIFFIHKMLRKDKISLFVTRQHILMFILLLIVPISNLSNFQIKAAWDSLFHFLTVFLLFFIIVNLADDFNKFQKVYWTLLVCTTTIAINGLIQHFRGVDLIGNQPVLGRIYWIGIFGDPNVLALLLTSFVPFILVNVFEENYNVLKKFILIAIGAIFIMAIYYTNSRGGFVALAIVLVYYCFKRFGWVKGLVVGACVLAIAIFFAPTRMSLVSASETSAAGRIQAWITGLYLLKTRPVFGVGFHNFTDFNYYAAHSAFVNCFAELGLVGYFTWLALSYTCFIDLRKIQRSREESPQKKYARILEISLAGFLAGAFFLSETYSPVYYILIALSTITIYHAQKISEIRRNLSRNELIHLVIIILVSIIGFKALAIVYS